MSGLVDLAFPGEPDYRDSPLLDAIRQGSSAAHGRLRDSWSVASDKALLQAAADSLPEVARGRPEEVPDALRWARRVGVITAITSMGVILTPRGLCLTATVTGSYDAQTFVSQDVPLMVAAGGPLVEYLGSTMHPRHLDLARWVISGCAPFDTLRLRKRLARILKVDDALAESASAPQVHHSTANAALRPIAPFLSPGCQADWGRLGAKDQVRILWALPKRPTEVLPHISGTGNELWAGLMVWASRQVGGASAGVPVTPLPKGLPEIRDWPLDVLRGAFEASTLPITTVEALGELLGDITPSWASAPVLALLASRGTEAPLSAASWTRVSSRTGGGAAAADLPVPAGAGASPVVDADAARDDDPTQPYVNVDGVYPTVSDPWRLLEPCAGATTGAAPSAGGDAVPRGAHTPEGESPSNPTGVSREIKFGGTSIYEFDAESPVGEHVEDSPTPLAIPGPAGSGLGGGSMPADRHTTHAVDSRRAPSDGGCALVAAHRAAQSGFPPPISNTLEILSGGSAGGSHASPVPATPQAPAPGRAGVHVSLGDGTGLLCPPVTAAGVPHRDGVPDRSPGERWYPESTGAGGRPPMDAGRRPPLWESRLQDLERDLEDAQATCQALSSEQDRRLQELQRVRADLHRSEGELASMRRDHATVSGELVRQRSRTRSLEEEGSSLRRQLADAQRAARDVAGAVDERLSRHLPAILEAVQIVRDEHISQPAVERALRGWVPAGYGPPSTANPNFREICATLVCAAVLRVDPPPRPWSSSHVGCGSRSSPSCTSRRRLWDRDHCWGCPRTPARWAGPQRRTKGQRPPRRSARPASPSSRSPPGTAPGGTPLPLPRMRPVRQPPHRGGTSSAPSWCTSMRYHRTRRRGRPRSFICTWLPGWTSPRSSPKATCGPSIRPWAGSCPRGPSWANWSGSLSGTAGRSPPDRKPRPLTLRGQPR